MAVRRLLEGGAGYRLLEAGAGNRILEEVAVLRTPWRGARSPDLWEIGTLDWATIDQMNPGQVLLAGYGDSMTDLVTPGWLKGMPSSYVVLDKGVIGELGSNPPGAGWERLTADAPGLVQNVVVALWGTNDLGYGHVLNDADWLTLVLNPFKSKCITAVAAVQARGISLILMVPPPLGAGLEDSIYTTRRAQIKTFLQTTFPSVPLIDLSGIDATVYIDANDLHFSAAGIAHVAGLVQTEVASIYPWAAALAAATRVPINQMTPPAQAWDEDSISTPSWKGSAALDLWDLATLDWISIDQMRPSGSGLHGAAASIDLMVPASTVWTEAP